MLLDKPLEIGDLKGRIYDFEFTGDILPGHVHDETNVHITIVCKGSVKAYSHDWEKEAVAGQIIDFRVGEPHEIIALEDNTRIVNIIKNVGDKVNEYSKA
jgi:quercetin dioxygenase-like cupin family protein